MVAVRTWFALQCSMTAALAACGGGGNATCVHDQDCASHFCKADGTCAPLQNTPDGSMPDGGSNVGSNGSGSNGVCTPNHDGMIEASELPLAAGRNANYLTAAGSGISWDTTGSAGSDNMRSWDLSAALAGDTEHSIMLTAPTGAWWASDFPAATYASILSESAPTTLGVFHVDAAGVTLIGVVSSSGGPTQTELTYDPPAKILAVPFMAGSSWTSTSTISGTLLGAPTAYSEEYDSTVDQVGTMKTPYGSFPVLRVATNLLRNSVADTRTFAWVAECFGSVAQVSSQAFPASVPSGEFSNPAEVWRITP